MVYGPCGFGGKQCPNMGNWYSPPVDDDTVKVAWASPNREGSNVTSTLISIPPLAAEAALTVFSTENSGEST